ncbi:hypothetical protein DFA_10456 [Cavenderia fasciculata]|uniref:Uncharacterized protein n=1 Tax=Cavenderia fasciculata TaxID=261658 RepID=F4QA95_CACFS|nr:uncharacterized protein DFA_10456 [Cavenderia fasciculata]EGG15614.1 hypothetical protein DFA_10456 [Cavenderia fasciculata]|eukprot:XP_004354356.1 hypothetical protein DFA_10456 [Cavenderia fasciculata]
MNSFQMILRSVYIRKKIFEGVHLIHKQLGIKVIKTSSLHTFNDYIKYRMTTVVMQHIDSYWRLIFVDSDGIYRNNHTMGRMICYAIKYDNHIVLKYLLDRIKMEKGPFQLTVLLPTIPSEERQGEEEEEVYFFKRKNCFSIEVFHLLNDDEILIESKEILKIMTRTAILVSRDIEIIRNLLKRYKLKIDTNDQSWDFKDLVNECSEEELVELFSLIKKEKKSYLAFCRLFPETLVEDKIKVIQCLMTVKTTVTEVFTTSPQLYSPFITKSTRLLERKKALYQLTDRYSRNHGGLLNSSHSGIDMVFYRYMVVTLADGSEKTCFIDSWNYCNSIANGVEECIATSIKENGHVLTHSTKVFVKKQSAEPSDTTCNLEKLFNSKFCQCMVFDYASVIACILDLDKHDLLEQVISFVKKQPKRCVFSIARICQYAQDDGQHHAKEQFISVMERIIDLFINSFPKHFQQHVYLFKKIINNYC